ncbi:unnamed protein product [Owenia fusiformis]|uniref:Uncharacterized protein n=1 Tax=Owenia fusiformis TaxID=6347 RepID=A0A8S4P2D4_OWEFU|nr:unnamed protein product [Owenia fusiformis]
MSKARPKMNLTTAATGTLGRSMRKPVGAEPTVIAQSESEVTMEVQSTADRSDAYIHTGGKRIMNMENTYRMSPVSQQKFNSCEVERVAEDVLENRLRDVQYDPTLCKQLSQELAGHIMERVKSCAFKRYKLVAVVSIGSLAERPGMQFGSRCLWNDSTDTFCSVKYSNGSLFAVAMVYGLYFE